MKLYTQGQIHKLGTHQFTLCFNKISGIYQLSTLTAQDKGVDVSVKVLLKSEQGNVARYELGTVGSLGQILDKKHIDAGDFVTELTAARSNNTHILIRTFGSIYTLYYLVKDY